MAGGNGASEGVKVEVVVSAIAAAAGPIISRYHHMMRMRMGVVLKWCLLQLASTLPAYLKQHKYMSAVLTLNSLVN